MTRSSLTEDGPSAPGWVDGRVRDAFAPFGRVGKQAGDAYADCLARVGGNTDVDLGHDGCRRAALAALEGTSGDLAALDRTLQALEAEISAST